MIEITDPAALVAAAICELSRRKGLPLHHGLRVAVLSRHERECGWCVYPQDELARAVKRARVDTVAFERMQQYEQRRAVIEAQAFEPLLS
jgi:hypothetical protein